MFSPIPSMKHHHGNPSLELVVLECSFLCADFDRIFSVRNLATISKNLRILLLQHVNQAKGQTFSLEGHPKHLILFYKETLLQNQQRTSKGLSHIFKGY